MPFMNWLAEGVRGLSPAYFALVMATGIVSIAADRAEFHTIAAVLLWLNAGQYLLLWILTCLLYSSPSPRDRQKSRMPSSA